MSETRKHSIKKWEVSIIELQSETGAEFKVTRQLPELKVVETKIFQSKKEAVLQFEEWLK